jgi:hypothetical protein
MQNQVPPPDGPPRPKPTPKDPTGQYYEAQLGETIGLSVRDQMIFETLLAMISSRNFDASAPLAMTRIATAFVEAFLKETGNEEI